MQVELTPVVGSKMIAARTYVATENTIYVKFKNGSFYKYTGTNKDLYDNWCAASSAGQFFNDNIKDRFDVERIS